MLLSELMISMPFENIKDRRANKYIIENTEILVEDLITINLRQERNSYLCILKQCILKFIRKELPEEFMKNLAKILCEDNGLKYAKIDSTLQFSSDCRDVMTSKNIENSQGAFKKVAFKYFIKFLKYGDKPINDVGLKEYMSKQEFVTYDGSEESKYEKLINGNLAIEYEEIPEAIKEAEELYDLLEMGKMHRYDTGVVIDLVNVTQTIKYTGMNMNLCVLLLKGLIVNPNIDGILLETKQITSFQFFKKAVADSSMQLQIAIRPKIAILSNYNLNSKIHEFNNIRELQLIESSKSLERVKKTEDDLRHEVRTELEELKLEVERLKKENEFIKEILNENVSCT